MNFRKVTGAAVLAVWLPVSGWAQGDAATATPSEAAPEAIVSQAATIAASEGTAGAQVAAALTVEVERPQTQQWPRRLETNGRLAAWQEAVIAAEVSGQQIVAVNADVGSEVRKGDILAELSSATIENTIAQQESAVQSAEAALDQARSDADRVRNLGRNGQGGISQQQVSEYLVAERKAEADLASAQASLASSQLDLERTHIVAPDDGVISARSASLGAVASSGTELFRLIRQNRIEWQAEVPLRFLPQLAVGTPAVIPTPNGDKVHGEVRLITPQSSETTGRTIVYVTLTPPENVPNPPIGMMITGRFELGNSEALTVPATAITMRDGFSYAFALEEGSDPPKVTRKRVETGRRLDDRVEILSGLTGEERVVRAGGAFLNEGSVVSVIAGAADDALASGEETDRAFDNAWAEGGMTGDSVTGDSVAGAIR